MKAAALFATGLFLGGCAIHDRPPHAFLPPVAEEYYVCAKCGSLHGGLYGKGPLLSFRAAGADHCIHHWVPITKADFRRRAERQFPSPWADAPPFFKQP